MLWLLSWSPALVVFFSPDLTWTAAPNFVPILAECFGWNEGCLRVGARTAGCFLWGPGSSQAVSVTTSSLSIDKVMLCVKPTPPGVLRAGAGDAFVGFYEQHALSLEGNSKAALSIPNFPSQLLFGKCRPVLHANHSTKRVLICARQFRVKSGSKDLPVGHFRVRPQNSGQSTVLRMRSLPESGWPDFVA